LLSSWSNLICLLQNWPRKWNWKRHPHFLQTFLVRPQAPGAAWHRGDFRGGWSAQSGKPPHRCSTTNIGEFLLQMFT
jgi:hypothetical protein